MDVSNLFNPGLYKITCLKNDKIYIGESSNILSRLGKHVSTLETNNHDCIELQTDFNTFGKIFFKFEALELNNKYLNENLRKQKEKIYIKKIKKSYNFKDKHNWNFYTQKVKIKGVIYNSLRQASSIVLESRTNLVRKCKDINNKDYILLEKQTYLKAKIYEKNSIPCQINTIIYPSISKASKTLNHSYETITKRCKSNKYPNYMFINQIDRSNDYPEGE
uniref:GIY-YIG domain-containing protein n=1 Tax=Ulva rigida TaxID=75689 RepID=A0A8F0L9K8_9CHLO|nr:hypothetical protein [Ulva rigida]